jgi:predicted ribosome quality control (RQC) complex YloA/Tae2 family protein
MAAAEIQAVVAELESPLAGARVRKVRQRGPHDLVLTLRVPGRNLYLLLSAHPRSSRVLGLVCPPDGPWLSSAFRDACRHDLEGGQVESIAVVPHDRRVTVTIRKRIESAEPASTTLFRLEAELFGRFANLVLVDSSNRIREVLRPVAGKRTLRARELYASIPPVPESREHEPRWITKFPAGGDFPVNRTAADHFESAVAAGDLADAALAVGRRIDAARKRLTRKAAQLTADLEAARHADEVQQQGELLKGHLDRIRRGHEQVTVLDYYSDPPVPRVIPLDPVKTPQENLAAIFKRYRKLCAGRDKTGKVLAEVKSRIQALDELAADVGAAPDVQAVHALEQEAIATRLLGTRQGPPRTRNAAEKTRPTRALLSFVSQDGLTILVGRSGTENETITFTRARGEDLWLHVQDYPGSHVVVQVPRGKPCPPETLLDAAHLAVHFSSLRGTPSATVHYTPRKYVARLKNAPAGRVTLSRHATLDLRMEPERLARLLHAWA